MEPEKKPEVIELNRYRKAAQVKAEQQAKAKTPRPEPLLGKRRNAGLLLIVILVAAVLLLVMPRLT